MGQCHYQNQKQYVEWEKLKSVQISSMAIEKNIWWFYFPLSQVDKNIIRIDFLLDTLPRDELNLIVPFKNVEILKNTFPATTISDIIKWFGVLILTTCCKFPSRHDMWYSRSQYKYIGTTEMGNKGLTRQMFDNMW